ncbi:MAG TPA: hypothetical protein VEP89_07175 [Draconibacterium sp.]|nr:hypothetical protein [Draconibacterium sp.]
MCKIRYILLIIVISFFSCKKEAIDPCAGYVDEVFQYPPFPENGWENDWYEESKALFEIPEQVLTCISTDNLITTCLNYPQFNIFYTYDTWQSGFSFVALMSNGFQELPQRQDCGSVMLERYLTMNPFNQNLSEHDFLEFEIFMSQRVILKKLTLAEKLALMEHALTINEDKIDAGFQYSEGKIGGYVIMGRMMWIDNFQPFMEVFNEDTMVLLRIFIDDAQWFYNDWCKPDEIISEYAIQYFEYLKEK